MSLLPRLAAALDDLAARQQTVTYGALARQLDIPGPGSIATLTAALEVLMEQDAGEGRPLRAALCAGRLAGGLPAPGFYAKAQALGCGSGLDPATFAAMQRSALFKAAAKG